MSRLPPRRRVPCCSDPGSPFGAAALGGANAGQLPVALRVVSAFATVAWLFAALIVLSHHQGAPRCVLPNALVWWGTRVSAGLLAAGTLMNVASSSPWERYGWGPFTLIMLVLCIALIRNGANGPRG